MVCKAKLFFIDNMIWFIIGTLTSLFLLYSFRSCFVALRLKSKANRIVSEMVKALRERRDQDDPNGMSLPDISKAFCGELSADEFDTLSPYI